MNTLNTSKNAISHGAYSADPVLPWENKGEFNALHEDLVDELNPVGRSEKELVFDLACLHWKKRRLNFGSQLAIRQTRDASKLEEAGRNGGWEGVADYLSSSVQDVDSLRNSIREMANKLRDATVGIHHYINKHLIKQLQAMNAPDTEPPSASATGATPESAGARSVMPPSPSSQANQLSEGQLERALTLVKGLQICSNQIIPTLRMLEPFDETLCHKAYNPEVLEKELKLHAMIDKQMEKKMQRLMLIQEYKKMHQPKLVGESSSGMKTLPANELGK